MFSFCARKRQMKSCINVLTSLNWRGKSKWLQFKQNKTETLQPFVLFLLSQHFTCVLTDSPDPQKKLRKKGEREKKREGKALISQSTAVCSAQSYTQTSQTHTHLPSVLTGGWWLTHTALFYVIIRQRSATRGQQTTQISSHSSSPGIETTWGESVGFIT